MGKVATVNTRTGLIECMENRILDGVLVVSQVHLGITVAQTIARTMARKLALLTTL